MTEISLNSPIEKITSKPVVEKLNKLGIEKAGDIVEFLPRRYEDHTNLTDIKDLKFDEICVIRGTVEKVSSRRSKRGQLIIQAMIKDKTGTLPALWFNQRYLLAILKEGQDILLYGQRKLVPTMKNPFFVNKIISKLGYATIYPSTKGLTQLTIRRVIEKIEPDFEQITDIFPDDVTKKFAIPKKSKLIQKCHFPTNLEALTDAKDLLGLEEFVTMLLAVNQTQNLRKGIKTKKIELPLDEIKKFVESLPYTLTPSQKKCAWEILKDIEKDYPMSRLLYGEVGSGKTVIGLMVCLAVLERSQKVTWLSPTTVLASQQLEVTKRMLGDNFKVGYFTGDKKDKIGDCDIIVGTHALLKNDLDLGDPSLIVIDEQHRFGVEQRNLLLSKYPKAHVLMLSATPIPRSMAQTIFGYLDITFLTDKPPHQQPIITKLYKTSDRVKINSFIKEKLKAGESGYVICPLINESDEVQTLLEIERKAVLSEVHNLKKTFPEAKIEMLHGKMQSNKKEQILSHFKNNEIDILLSTTVVEVGIDNPNATWILIEEADRFGLAQLHQLRGRVGRGSKESVCMLVNQSDSPIAGKRLQLFSEIDDGLRLAEEDLKLRGPGEIIGLEQSGLPSLKYANLFDKEMILRAKNISDYIIENKLTDYPILKEKIEAYANGLGTNNISANI